MTDTGSQGPDWRRLADKGDEQPDSRRAELRRLADAARDLIHGMVMTDADESTLAESADALELLAAHFHREDGPGSGSVLEGFTEASTSGDPDAFFEHSPVLGVANPIAPPVTLRSIDDLTVQGDVTFGAAYEGPPGHVHGGYVAAGFDEVLGVVQSLSGQPGMTGSLTVRYRSPTPLHQPLVYTARLDGVDGRKVRTSGTLHVGDRLCAEAEGLFIAVDFSRMAELRERRAEQATRRRRSGDQEG